MKGIEFSKDSDFSKRISENDSFQQSLRNVIDKNKGTLPDKIELDFSKDSKVLFSLYRIAFVFITVNLLLQLIPRFCYR